MNSEEYSTVEYRVVSHHAGLGASRDTFYDRQEALDFAKNHSDSFYNITVAEKVTTTRTIFYK